MAGLIEHLEASLGPTRGGFTIDADGARMPFQIAQFDGRPVADMVTLVTLGFGEYRLRLAHSRVRQELLFAARPRFTPGSLPGIVQQVRGRRSKQTPPSGARRSWSGAGRSCRAPG